MKKRRTISIICAVFNEQESVPIFYSRLQQAVAGLRTSYGFELIFVNDNSTDETLKVILGLQAHDPAVHVLTLSRNFGYQAAVLAGMTYARGDGMMTIDVDCEDPPELIGQFVEKWEEGYDIVYGLRAGRPEAWIITEMRRIFYRSLKVMADSDIILDMAEFALISAHVRDIIVNNQNTFPFLRAEIGYAGFSRTGIRYDRQVRVKGKSHYNIWKMALFAGGGILTSSTFPMRFAFYFLPLFLLINVAGLILDLLLALPSLFKVLITFDIVYGTSLLTVFGLYFARIYKNSISRPVFVIDWKRSHYDSVRLNEHGRQEYSAGVRGRHRLKGQR